MPSNYTQNYQLNQWAADDQVCRTDFNADNAKIDGALAGFATALAQKGNCRIVTGQYTGDGTMGPDSTCILTFDHKPLVLMIANSTTMIAARGGNGYVLNNGPSSYVSVVWKDKSVSWYTDVSGAVASRQMNMAGFVYTYVVLLEL